MGVAAAEAFRQDGRLDARFRSPVDGAVENGQHRSEPVRAAAIRIMGMRRIFWVVAFPMIAVVGGRGGVIKRVMMDRSVGMDVNMQPQSRDLSGNLVETIFAGGAVSERDRGRRHDDASAVKKRHQCRQAISHRFGQNSKHSYD